MKRKSLIHAWPRSLNFLLIFLFSLGSLIFMGSHHLFQPVSATGDLAADMLLMQRIWEDGLLLVGQYSRYGFYHPGPIHFYCYALFETLFLSFFPSVYNVWVFTNVLINALLLAFICRTSAPVKRSGQALRSSAPVKRSGQALRSSARSSRRFIQPASLGALHGGRSYLLFSLASLQ